MSLEVVWEHRKPGYGSQRKPCQKEVSGLAQWDKPQSHAGVCLHSPQSLTRRESVYTDPAASLGELLEAPVFLGSLVVHAEVGHIIDPGPAI